MTSQEKLYKALTNCFIGFLVFHLLVASVLILNPDKDNLTNSSFEKAYRLFGLTGPFFSENRINVVPRAYCAIKPLGKEWEAYYELGAEDFDSYHQLYINHDKLLFSTFPRHLFFLIKQEGDTPAGDRYREVVRQYIQRSKPTVEIDSVTLVYVLESLKEAKTDTLFVMKVGGFGRITSE